MESITTTLFLKKPMAQSLKKMLAKLPDSMFNVDGAWSDVRKKVTRSAKAWGEED